MKNQLPDFVIAALYKDALVLIDDVTIHPLQNQTQITKKGVAEEREIPHTEDNKWYLGNNKKNIAIIVSQDDAVFVSDNSLNLLSSILAACKLNLGDVAVVNHHQNKFTFTQLKDALNPQYLFLFGVDVQQVKLPFTMPYYQVQRYNNCTFLMGPSLADIIGESKEARVEKSKLWVCLKKIFNV